MLFFFNEFQANSEKCILPSTSNVKEQVNEIIKCLANFDKYGKLLNKANQCK